MPIVALEDVSKRYPHGDDWAYALSDVNLVVEQGTIQGIIGFSGAGKSTLLRCISRLECPEKGRILIAGSDLAILDGNELRLARRKLGVVFQQFHLMRSRTVGANVALPLEIAGEPASAIAERVHELLGWVGLQDKANAYPAQLSGGQRQRVAIARALAAKPAVLLTDEPTSALDPETSASVLELLKRIRDELGVTILLITHEINAVRAICDRVAVLDRGRVVEDGTVEQVLTRPASRATERLLGRDVHLSQLAAHLGDRSQHENSIFLELQFFGKGAGDEILFDLARTSAVKISILRAEILNLNQSGYGSLLIELSGTADALSTAQQLLNKNGATVTLIDPWKSSEDDVEDYSNQRGAHV
jgi:D-methionine transport system ATP-binding protein